MIAKNCVICGKEFFVYPSTMTTMTCGRQCSAIYSGQMRNTQVTKTCPVCGKIFKSYKCRPTKTCSKKCARALQYQDSGVNLICVVCGKEFNVPPCRANTAKACSNECAVLVRAKSRERKVICVCENCGKEFESPLSIAGRRVYCSKACQYSSKEFLDGASDRVSGDKNPMWKGGETDHSSGYIYAHTDGHPFSSNNYVLKHRLIMEDWLKEENPDSEYLIKLGDSLYLSPNYIVHHLDWDRKKNDRSNLLVCTSSIHTKLHRGTCPEPGTYWPHNAKIRLGKKQ